MDSEIASDEFIDEEKEKDDSSIILVVEDESDTEKEIEDENSDNTRAKVKIIVQMGNEALRKPLNLSDKYPTECSELYLEMLPKIVFDTVDEEAGEEVQEPIVRKTFDQGVQASIFHRHREMQTSTNKLLNAWTQYEPRLCSKDESVRVMDSALMKSFLSASQQRTQKSLVENTVADNFFFDINSLCSDDCEGQEEKTSLIENMSFSCALQHDAKMISCLNWHPFYKGIFVASTVQTCRFEEKTEHLSTFLLNSCSYYMWSLEDQTVPRLLLESFDEILTIQFCPTLPHIIAGGGIQGQIILWDISKEKGNMNKKNMFSQSLKSTSSGHAALSGKRNSVRSPVISSCVSSSIHYNHLNGIYHLEWIPPQFQVKAKGKIEYNNSNKSFQLVTCGFDGMLRFWDLRSDPEAKTDSVDSNQYYNLDGLWKPFHLVELISHDKKHVPVCCFSLRAHGGINDLEKQKNEKLNRDRTEGSDLDEQSPNEFNTYTEFCAGSEEGEIFCGSFELVKDKAGKFSVKPLEFYTSLDGIPVHGGVVETIAYSPFMDDIFLSVGAQTIALWKCEIKKGPLLLKVFDESVTAGLWSKTKPSVFIVGFVNGNIAVWNVLQNSKQPIHVQAVTTSAIKVISIQVLSEKEQILAVGDYNGIAHILTFPSVLWIPIEDELSLVRKFFDREAKRVLMEMKKQELVEEEKAAEARRLEESAKKKKDAPKMVDEKKSEDDVERNALDLYENFLALQKEQMEELGYWHQDKLEEDLE